MSTCANWSVVAVAIMVGLGCSDTGASSSRARGFRITASGEELAQLGYAFPPAAGQEVFFADGWEVEFRKVFVVVDHVHLSESPDLSPSDASQTGSVVAELKGGPFAIDLAATGAGSIAAKRSGERAWPLGTMTETREGDGFDAAKRYAFGYSFVEADSGDPELVGIEDDDADFAAMREAGYTHLLVGTATRRASIEDCETTSSYDFSQLPTTVDFRLGFSLSVESVNCQNPELTGEALVGEESQRGVQGQEDEMVDVQITLHTDHLFWNTVEHGAIPLFNHLAAHAAPQDSGAALLTAEGLEGAPLAPATDRAGASLGWMSCVGDDDYQLPTSPATFTVDSAGTQGIEDLYDFVRHNAATMGHLNQDGLCFVAGFEHTHHHDD